MHRVEGEFSALTRLLLHMAQRPAELRLPGDSPLGNGGGGGAAGSGLEGGEMEGASSRFLRASAVLDGGFPSLDLDGGLAQEWVANDENEKENGNESLDLSSSAPLVLVAIEEPQPPASGHDHDHSHTREHAAGEGRRSGEAPVQTDPPSAAAAAGSVAAEFFETSSQEDSDLVRLESVGADAGGSMCTCAAAA